MTGTDVARFTHESVPVIFEPPCMIVFAFYRVPGHGDVELPLVFLMMAAVTRVVSY